MDITLFEHNRIAYQKVLRMLEETGKAAIIHPTGMGKSFIGFKLCQDFQDKTVGCRRQNIYFGRRWRIWRRAVRCQQIM